MRTLLIMRHGKSAWDQAVQKDFDRKLLPLGIDRTHWVAEKLLENKLSPELIISSPAIRALQTASIMAQDLNYPEKLIMNDRNLYFEGTDDYFSTLFTIPEHVKSVMIVGHNPMITTFANYFLTEKLENLPTSGLVAIAADARAWTEFVNADWTHIVTLLPKKMMTHGS